MKWDASGGSIRTRGRPCSTAILRDVFDPNHRSPCPTMIYGELSPSQQVRQHRTLTSCALHSSHDTGRFLLAKANEARAALVDGKRIGFDRRLGILSCPYWWRLPRWRNVPPRPYRALRVYRMEFIVGEMARNHDRVSRTLMMESEP